MNSTRKTSAETPSVMWHKSRTDYGAINTADRAYRIHERTFQRYFEAYTPFGSFRTRSLCAAQEICERLSIANALVKNPVQPCNVIKQKLQQGRKSGK